MKLYRLMPKLVEGTYNHSDIDIDDWLYMRERSLEFISDKSGVAPKLSPYSPNLVFESGKTWTHLAIPYFAVESGFIVSLDLDRELQKLVLAEHVRFPLVEYMNGKLCTRFYYFFYSSFLEFIDPSKSLFNWTDPNHIYYKDGKLIEMIVKQETSLSVEFIRRNIQRKINGFTLRCERMILKSYMLKYDLFEMEHLSMFFLSTKAFNLLNNSKFKLDIIETSSVIDEG